MRARRLLPWWRRGVFRRCGGRDGLDETHRLIVDVAGEEVHTELGRSGGGESVLYVVLPTTGDVVAERNGLIQRGH